ncbi:protein vreteno-like [Drosophila guanche]|uniref:Blast:Protein vreteno n=1 Tax=Drosophila guanche TaxID=7266 RepID=A0A3B0KQ50_DROGU|nr:protein vreteno-like [Drosophila guanche]SPP88749.1 blast:Protein vreteno [Drosophila guanche]
MDKLLEDWSQWNPMVLDFNNEHLNNYAEECGHNVVEKARVPLKPSDMLQKEAAKADAEYPFLVLKKKVSFVTKCAVLNFFDQSHVRSIDMQAKSDIFKVFFNDLGSLEAAHSQLEAFPQLMQLHRRQFGGEEKPKPKSKVSDSADPVKLPALVPTARGNIDLSSRTIHVSTSGNRHPEFLVVPIVDATSYKGSSHLAIRDAEKRFLSVKFEYNLERYGAYVLEREYEDESSTKPLTMQLRCGRKLYIRSSDLDDVQRDVNVADDDSEELDMSGYKKCAVCNGYTSTVCKICEMPFCDAFCWSIVSMQHDKKCGTGQEVDINDESFEKLVPKCGLPPKRTLVKITAFEQSNVVYVRPADTLSDVAYNHVLAEVWKHGQTVAKLDQLPVCGQIVIYKFGEHVVRAMVLNVDNPRDICVVSIDYGSVEYTDPGNLYQCSSYVSDLPRYATPVKLRGVPRRAVTPNLREVMYGMQGCSMTFQLRYHTREYDNDNHMQRAVLIFLENNRTINSLLKHVITPIEPDLSDPGLTEDILPHVAAPTGKNTDLIITDNSFLKYGIIYCTPTILAVEITKMQRAFQDYGENIAKADAYAAPKGQLCIAKYMGKWSRGVSMELVGDGYPSILFLDYGNIVPVHVTDIRAYPPQFTYPVLTTEYVLMGLPENLSDVQVERLERRLALGAIVTCDEIVKDENNKYSLLFKDIQQLVLR